MSGDGTPQFGLHDATLVSVQFNWGSAVAVFRFLTHAELVRVRVEHCQGVDLPRQDAWGHSNSVLGLWVLEAGAGIEVKMQSGDCLRALGRVSVQRFSHRSTQVVLTAWRPGLRKVPLATALRGHADIGLAQAKAHVDALLAGDRPIVVLRHPELAQLLLEEARDLGCDGHMLAETGTDPRAGC